MNANSAAQIDEFIRNLHLFTYLTRHNMENRFVRDATDKPVSFVQMNLLRVLSLHPGQTVGNVAKFMNVSYPGATKTIDKLTRLGLVKRQEDSSDRRVSQLHLTPGGKRVVEKYTQVKATHVQLVLDKFGEENARSLSRILHSFSKAVVNTLPIKEGVCMQCGAFDPACCCATESEKSCGLLDEHPSTPPTFR